MEVEQNNWHGYIFFYITEFNEFVNERYVFHIFACKLWYDFFNCVWISKSVEEYYHLAYNAVLSVESRQMFRRDILQAFHLLLHWFLAGLILWPWRWKWCVPPKRQLTFSWLHSVISQKIVLFIITALKTKNSSKKVICCEESVLKVWHWNLIGYYILHI
jgi:hypothetical protein